MLSILMLLPACTIVRDLPRGTPWDTGTVYAAGETDLYFMAEPDRIERHGKANIEITAEPNLSFVGLEDIYSMGPVEMLAFEAFEDRLTVLVSTKPTAQQGTVSFLFDFGDEEVHFAKDVVDVDLSVPNTPQETKADEMVPTGTGGQQNTGKENSGN